MSKSIGAALKTHLAGEVLTLAYLWKVTREDGAIYGFTTHDRDILYSGLVYTRLSGLMVTDISQKSDLSVDNLDLSFVLDADVITIPDLAVGRWDGAVVEVSLINYDSTGDGVVACGVGTIGQITLYDASAKAEFRGATQPVTNTLGRRITPMCDAALGDSRCGVNLASYTVSGTLTAVSSNTLTDTSLAQATGYFDSGVITFTSGTCIDLRFEVKTFTSGGTMLLYTTPMFSPSIGDTFTLSPGCNKLLKDSSGAYTGDCKAKYNNVINFQGFPEVPGIKRLSQTPS